MAFEGQAAMQLEGLAQRHGPVPADLSLFTVSDDLELDLTPLVHRLAGARDAGFGAAFFHATLIAALAEWIAQAAARERIAVVAGGGGCFLNAILDAGLASALAHRGLTFVQAQAAPPNDGGLALGQAWVGRRFLDRSI
jgi:hydrogenase maturation protein HypF